MTVAALVEYLFEQINNGGLCMSDKVPEEILHMIDTGHETAAEYLARKYEIGGDSDE